MVAEVESENLPNVSYIIQSYDTAFPKKENADYSAISTWGVFRPDEDSIMEYICTNCN